MIIKTSKAWISRCFDIPHTKGGMQVLLSPWEILPKELFLNIISVLQPANAA